MTLLLYLALLFAHPQTHGVTLSWQPSTDRTVTMYSVVRGQTKGGPYANLVCTTLSTEVSCFDKITGGPYWYVVSAYSPARGWSSYSNEIGPICIPIHKGALCTK